jgi:hypothetical protein
MPLLITFIRTHTSIKYKICVQMNVINEGMTRLECYVPISSELLSAHLRKKNVAFETS